MKKYVKSTKLTILEFKSILKIYITSQGNLMYVLPFRYSKT